MTKNRNKRQPARQQPATAASVNTPAQQQAHSNNKMHPQHRASLADRMTRDDQSQPQSQQGGEKQAAREQASAKKRKRGETDNGAQQQKRTRLDTDFQFVSESQSAERDTGGQTDVFENIVQSATNLKTLQNMSDKQKMARRRDRFANAPLDRRTLGVSRVTKTSGSLPASIRKTHDERKTAGVERAVASDHILANTHGRSSGDRDELGAIIGQELLKKKDDGNEIASVEAVDRPVHQTIDMRTNSVAQSSPTLIANNQGVGDRTIRDISPHDSPSSYKKSTVKGHDTASMVDLKTGAQHDPQNRAAQTKPKNPERTDQTLQAPRVVINDDRQPIVEPNPEYVLDYKPYDFTSVLLMASFNIAHDEDAEESVDRWYRSNQILNREAMDMYKRPWTPQDLGRGTVSKTLPTRIINDCDLYFRDDQKIYVATEMGLLLVADYCRAIGVPEQQAIRFEGRKPKWAKKLEADRHYRRVELYHPQNKDSYLQPCISLDLGSTVEVYERCQAVDAVGIAWNFAYGRRTEDGVRGFFDYGHTCRMDWGMDSDDESAAPDLNVIDWSKFDYGPGARNARKYIADLAAGKYAPQSRGRTSAITKAPAASGGTSAMSKSSMKSVVGNMAVTGSRAAAAAPASPTTIGPATFTTTATEAKIGKPVLFAKAGSIPAGDTATAPVEATIITVDQSLQRTEMLSVAGGPIDDSSQDDTENVDTCLKNYTQRTSQAFDDTDELGSPRHDSHEPSTDTDNENVQDNTKADTADHDITSRVPVAPPTPAPPTTTVGTIRRRVGPNEYVEDEIDYDDDEL